MAHEIQYFDSTFQYFSFYSYVYYLTYGFTASTRAFFRLPTRAFNLPTRAFSLLNHGFELLTCGF